MFGFWFFTLHRRTILVLSTVISMLLAYAGCTDGKVMTSDAGSDGKVEEDPQVEIIPMPKEVALIDSNLDLSQTVILLGAGASPQDHIGATWIHDELVAQGGEAPTIVTVGQPEGNPSMRVVIGTRDTNPLIDDAVAAEILSVGPGNPGPQGYMIQTVQGTEAPVAYLAGVDPVGTLYACVTFAELVFSDSRGVYIQGIRVRDWPDFQKRLIGGTLSRVEAPDMNYAIHAIISRTEISEAERQSYLETAHAFYDRILRYKGSMAYYSHFFFNDENNRFQDVTAAARTLIREGIEYGKERGIGAYNYSFQPFAGLTSEHPGYDGPCLPSHDRWSGWIRGWARELDDMRRSQADKVAQFFAEIGFTDIGLHDTDTGGFYNPAQWDQRSDAARTQWPGEGLLGYADATANKYLIYFDAIKVHDPTIKVHATIYPYGVQVLTQEGARELHLPVSGLAHRRDR